MTLRIALTVIALGGLLVLGCNPQTPIDQRYGQILPPNMVKCPRGCVAYVTAQGDTLYSLTEKFYSDRYKMCLIQNQNKDTLKKITKPDGTLEKGKIIFLPPDLNGRPVGTKTPDRYWSRGDWK